MRKNPKKHNPTQCSWLHLRLLAATLSLIETDGQLHALVAGKMRDH